MTDKRKDEMPEEIWVAVPTFGNTKQMYAYATPPKYHNSAERIKYIRAASPPVPDAVTVSREVLMGVRDVLNNGLGNCGCANVGLCHGACRITLEDAATKALTTLDAVLKDGE